MSAQQTHCEAHDSRAGRRDEGLRYSEDLPPSAPQLLPLVAAKLAIHALSNVARQLQVLHLRTQLLFVGKAVKLVMLLALGD